MLWDGVFFSWDKSWYCRMVIEKNFSTSVHQGPAASIHSEVWGPSLTATVLIVLSSVTWLPASQFDCRPLGLPQFNISDTVKTLMKSYYTTYTSAHNKNFRGDRCTLVSRPTPLLGPVPSPGIDANMSGTAVKWHIFIVRLIGLRRPS